MIEQMSYILYLMTQNRYTQNIGVKEIDKNI